MPDLIATKPQRYATRALAAGDPFAANNRDARLLLALKRATLAPVPAPGPTLDDLQTEAERLGVHVDKRWGTARLQDEIAKARG